MSDFKINLLSGEEKFALLFGILLGDGCLSHYICKNGRERKGIVITGHKEEDMNFYKSVLAPLLKSLTENSVRIKERKDCRAIAIHIFDKMLFEKINILGFPIGKKGYKIKIPKIFYDKGLIKQIIQGFFATDGSLVITKNPNKFYPRLESHAICKNLLLQICDYLNKQGMKGHFYISKRKKKEQRWKIIQQPYKFQFNGKENLLLFKKLIDFVNPKHEKRFIDFLEYSKKYDCVKKEIYRRKQKSFTEKINNEFIKKTWLLPESNRGPRAHETRALPTELSSQNYKK